MSYRFTDRMRRALALARQEAIRLGHGHIGTEHLLLGLLGARQSGAGAVLDGLGIGDEQLRGLTEAGISPGSSPGAVGEPPYTEAAQRALELAMLEARELHHSHVGTEHLLLGLLREGEGTAARVLNELGISLGVARAQTRGLIGSGTVNSEAG